MTKKSKRKTNQETAEAMASLTSSRKISKAEETRYLNNPANICPICHKLVERGTKYNLINIIRTEDNRYISPKYHRQCADEQQLR